MLYFSALQLKTSDATDVIFINTDYWIKFVSKVQAVNSVNKMLCLPLVTLHNFSCLKHRLAWKLLVLLAPQLHYNSFSLRMSSNALSLLIFLLTMNVLLLVVVVKSTYTSYPKLPAHHNVPVSTQ